MMNNEEMNLENNSYPPIRYYFAFTLLAITLLYAIVIFFYDNLLPLLQWIPYRFLETITPSIFIPNIADKGSYEKSIIWGLMNFSCTIFLPVYMFCSSFQRLVKYKGVIGDKNNAFMIMEDRIGGAFNSQIRLIEILILLLLFIIAFIYMLSKTDLILKEPLFEIFLVNIFMLLIAEICVGFLLAIFVYKVIYK